ncbi:MAG TPA: chloride channel protein [Vicinamibacteria bacterium]|nr:chloride channel protein [Vicinamibacteria bacterium]
MSRRAQGGWPAPLTHAGAEPTTLLLRALSVGLLAGGAALLLRWAATEGPHLLWPGRDLVQGVALASPAARVTIPAVGGLLAGLVLGLGLRWTGGARGWDILEAVVLRNGVLPLRSALVQAASSIVTQATAGAVGREGPIVLVAAATASSLGQRLGVAVRERRVLVGCGMAAGLACAYNTPVGAALFTLEIVFGTLSIEVFAPLAISSAVATLLTWAAFGHDPVFQVPPLALSSPWEIGLFAALGALGGATAALFLFALRTSAGLYRRLPLARPLAMATAGLVLGVVTLRYPEIVGNGREAIGALFGRPWGAEHVLALVVLRLVVTPLAVGSGTVGGVFTPTLFIGAMLGQAFGAGLQAVLPGLEAEPGAYAVAGMGFLLAGTTHAPLTAVVMVFEMTLDYKLVVPLLLGAAVASLVATRLSTNSVYTEALHNKAGEPAGEGRGALDVLRVADLVRSDQVTAPPDLSLPSLLDAFVASRRNHLYVVDEDGAFVGAVKLHDVNEVLGHAEGAGALTARDLMRSRFETTVPEETLPRVLERFAAQECERLPVLADRESRRLVGTISRRDILSVYSLELLQRDTGRGPVRPMEPPLDSLVDEVPLPAALEGRTFAESRFRESHALALLLVRRGAAGLLLPEAGLRFARGDRLVVFGPLDRIAVLKSVGSEPAAPHS